MVIVYCFVFGIVEAPFACSLAQNVDLFFRLVIFTQLNGCFGCNEVEFREFGDYKWTGEGTVRLSKTVAIVGTVSAKFPKTRVGITTDVFRFDNPVCTTLGFTCANIALS